VSIYPDDLHIAVAVGTRPEIVKLASIVRILGKGARFLHTGQHADTELSGVFLEAARLPPPEILDGICGQPRHTQVGLMIERLGAIFTEHPPAAVLVQGDTNTASAAAQAGNYARAPVVHVEADLRYYDRAMPEGLNRCVISVLADLHCAPTEQAVRNLRREGVPGAPRDPSSRILLTGNTIVEATNEMAPDNTTAGKIAAALAPIPANTSSPRSTARRTPTIRSASGPSSTS
jgi:UDP-N-acetylglucosamine 2-epimerase (non-hydrolysing)